MIASSPRRLTSAPRIAVALGVAAVASAGLMAVLQAQSPTPRMPQGFISGTVESSKGREAGQPFAQKARAYLTDLVLNRRVEIRSIGHDRYGRMLGEVFRNGTNINLQMVSAGLAEVYRGRPAPGLNMESYRRAEADARSRRREMWTQGENYLSPQTWRQHDRHAF